MVGDPADVDDVVQETLIAAYGARSSFRGDAAFSTWLCAIGTRKALDFLRRAQRWRARAQVIYAAECVADETLGEEVGAVLHDPSVAYDAREHIAFCFTCVGRSLPPEQQAAVVLRDILGLSNGEAADALGVSTPVLRHALAAGRESMQQRFEGLCALVNKEGVCHQCSGLRQATPEQRRGPEIPDVATLADRLGVVRQADLYGGATRALHELFFRRIGDLERRQAGDAEATTDCGQER